MTAAADSSTTLALRIPASLKAELTALSKSTGRNRNTLATEALRRFIDAQRWQIATIEDRLRQADAGDFATDEEMAELWAEFGLDDEDEGDETARAVS